MNLWKFLRGKSFESSVIFLPSFNRYQGKLVEKVKNTETEKYRDREIQRKRDTETERYRDII